MSNILKNSWTLFTRNKEYFSSIVLAPIIMLLVFSFVLSFQSKINIAIINQDKSEFGTMIEKTIEDMDFIKPLFADINDVETDIINGKIDLAIIIEKNASSMDLRTEKPIRIIKSQNSSLSEYMEAILNTQIENYKDGNMDSFTVSQNTVSEKGVSITNALGLVIFKMIGSASLLAGLIIMEKKNGIRNRIYMSRTKVATYLVGRGSIFFAHLLLFSFIYFLTARLLNFDFGMKYPAQILVIFVVLGIFTTSFGLLLSAFANDDNSVWRFGVVILLPTSILSGALFPFEAMPKGLQTIGNFCPQRWITIAVETLQNGGALTDIFISLFGVLAISIVFFAIASVQLNKSTV